MNVKTNLPLKLSNIVNFVVAAQIEYVKKPKTESEPKITTHLQTFNIPKIVNILKKNFNNVITKILIEENLRKIIEGLEEVTELTTYNIGLLIFDFLRTIFEKTNQLEKQCYFWEICEYYYENFTAKIFQLEDEEFWRIVRSFIPIIKLQALNKNFQENFAPTNFLLREVFECVAFPRILREDCYEIVFNKIKTKEYKFQKFDLLPLEQDLGYLGEYFRLQITITKEHSAKDLAFFNKFIPKTNPVCESIALMTFKKEEFFYKRLIPLLEKHGLEDLTDIAPKCYYTVKNSFIVLEDIRILGYITHRITVPLEYDFIVAVIKQLSRFHCWSILLDRKLSETSGTQVKVGDIFSEFLIESNFNRNLPTGVTMCYGVRLAADYFVEKFPNICKSVSMTEFKNRARIEGEKSLDNLGRSDKFYNVICHGDMWTSNILTNSETKCIFVDYQLLRYCPPITDLFFFIYISTERSFRLKHMDKLLEIYYESLKHNLKEHNFCIEDIMTSQQFSSLVKDYKPTGIFQAISYVQVLLLPPEFSLELATNPEKAVSYYEKERMKYLDTFWNYQPFVTRISGLVQDLYDVLMS